MAEVRNLRVTRGKILYLRLCPCHRPTFQRSSKYDWKSISLLEEKRRESICKGPRSPNSITELNPINPGVIGMERNSVIKKKKNEVASSDFDIIFLLRYSPRVRLEDKEVQCNLVNPEQNEKLEEQFRETVKFNSILAEDLGAAKKEIEILRGRLKELEVCFFFFEI